MKKKITLLMASLCLFVGTAWAQVLTTTIHAGKEYTLQCKATDHDPFIADDGATISGRAVAPTSIVFEASETEGGYYMKSVVSGKYINCDGTSVTASDKKTTIWKATAYEHTANAISLSCPEYAGKYLNNNNAGGTATGTSGLKMNPHTGGPGAGNACSLWYLREATPEVASGKVYRIVNKANSDKSICETSSFVLGTKDKADNDNSQLWYVEGSNVEGYTFRNLSTANYFNYVDEYYTLWSTIDQPIDFYLTKMENAGESTPNYYAITFRETALSDDNTLAHAHYSNGNIVRWNATADASKWAFEEVSVDANAAWNALYANWKAGVDPKVTEANTLLAASGFSISPVALTTGNTTCPAAISDNTDGGGVPALLDDDNDTFMHTKYSGKGSVGEPHYIQVDLGENNSAKYITFSYRARHNNHNNNPETIIIKGSVDGTEYTDIQTLTNLPDGLIEYESPVVGNGTAYRYFRFVVTATTNMASHEGYVFFSLGKFRMNTVTINDAYVGKSAVLSNLKAWVSENGAAETRPADWCLKAANQITEELDELVYGATLREYPFTLTTDVNAPVCYQILSGRGNANTSYYFTLKPNDGGKVKLETTTKDNVYSYWFFMEEPATGKLMVVPFMEESMPLGYVAVADGDSKLTNVHSTQNFAGYHYEVIEYSGVNGFPYALKPYKANTNVSNHGGTGNFMGFYNGAADGGSAVKFEVVDCPAIEFRSLPAAIATANSKCPGSDRTGTMLNGYSEASVNAYKAAVANVEGLYNAASTTAETINEHKNTLNNLYSVLEINLPEDGKFYRVRCSDGNKRILSTLTAVTNKGDRLSMANTVTDESIFCYTNGALVSYQEGLSINASNYNNVGAVSNVVFSKAVNKVLGCYNVKVGDRWIFGSGDYIDSGSGTTPDERNGYNWWLEEVNTLPVTVTAAGYATLFAPVALSIPEGVTAYTGTVNGAWLTLNEVMGGVIPANTGVVLKAAANTYNFVVADNVEGIDGNDLAGTAAKASCTAEANYTLANGEDGVGFYLYQGTTLAGFRAYLPKGDAAAPALRIRLAGEETGIEQIAGDAELVIYDLAGRRVEKMEKGIYIVNGKKVVIK